MLTADQLEMIRAQLAKAKATNDEAFLRCKWSKAYERDVELLLKTLLEEVVGVAQAVLKLGEIMQGSQSPDASDVSEAGSPATSPTATNNT